MKTLALGVTAALTLFAAAFASGAEARYVRYPHYHNGKVAFTYMGDIWTADESGQNVQRLTAHRGRDHDAAILARRQMGRVFQRPRRQSRCVDRAGHRRHAASNSRFIRPTTTCSAGRPTASRVLFASNRSDDFLGTLYVVPLDGSAETKAGTDFGIYGCFSPDGSKLAVNRKGQSYWRKGYRGSYQTDVTVVDLKSKVFQRRDQLPRHGHMADVGQRWLHLFRQRPRRQGPVATSGACRKAAAKPRGSRHSKMATCAFPRSAPTARRSSSSAISACGSSTWRRASPKRFRSTINAEPQDTLTEYRTVNSDVDDYDVAPTGRNDRGVGARRVVFGAGGRRRRSDAADQRLGPRSRTSSIRPTAS